MGWGQSWYPLVSYLGSDSAVVLLVFVASNKNGVRRALLLENRHGNYRFILGGITTLPRARAMM